MVLYKASVWYENVVKPLRRLTSATSNMMTFGQRQTARAASPLRRGEVQGAENAHGLGMSRGQRPTLEQHGAQSARTWRDLLQNPLDVILNETHAPSHPVNLFSQTVNRPVSASVVDQARRKPPEREAPRSVVERPSTRQDRSTIKPRPLAPSSLHNREVGSKKYRKQVRDRIMRKGPHFNIRRQNRLCMNGDISGASVSSAAKSLVADWTARGTLVASFKPGNKDVLASCANGSLKNTALKSVNGGDPSTSSNLLKKEEGKLGQDSGAVSSVNEKEESSAPVIINATKTRETRKVVRKTLGASFVKMSGGDQANPSVAATAKCGVIERRCLCGNAKKATVSGMRDNLEEAVQGFKCNLWKRAVTGDASIRGPRRVVDCVPCYVSAKSN